MLTLGLTAPAYNAMLSIFLLMVIKLSIRDRDIAKCEMCMHISAISMPLLVTIVAAVSIQLFNNYSHVSCWWLTQSVLEVKQSSSNKIEEILILVLLSITLLVCGVAVFSELVIAYRMKSIYFHVKGLQETNIGSHLNQYL